MEETLNELKEILIQNNLTVSIAESCTGGLISSYLTDISGASDFVNINFVTYAVEEKIRFLNVKKETVEKYTVVSEEVALEMAKGLFKYAPVTLSTTGYSGPTGGDDKNPVGTVYIGLRYKNKMKAVEFHSKFKTRKEIKKDFAEKAIKELLQFLKTVV